MEATLAIVLPVFGLIAIGYAVGKTPLLIDDGVKGLTNFVFYVAIPALLFKTMGTLEYPEGVDLTIMPAYYGAALLLFGAALAAGRFMFRLPLDQAAMFGMGSTFSNSVLLGLPLVVLGFGEGKLLPILLIISIHPLVLITVPTIVIEIGRGSGANWRQIGVSAVLSLLRNPVIIGMAGGVLYGLTDYGFHPVVAKLLDFLGRAAAPTALVALGASLTRFRIAGDLPQVAAMTVLKLLVLPALVWVSTSYVFRIDPEWAAIATLNAAMPSGANVFMLAAYYGTYVARAAATVLVSTALAILTAAFMIGRFAVGGG